MVNKVDQKVAEVLRSPIGCEFLLSVEASGLRNYLKIGLV